MLKEKVKLTPKLNLLDDPALLIAEFTRIKRFFNRHKIEWYVQSSFATNYYGVSDRKVTDIDIRAEYDIRKLFNLVKKDYSPDALLRPPARFGQGEFRTPCIIIPFGKTHVDIFTRPVTYNKKDKVEYRLPFDRNYRSIKFHSVRIPICSLEYLVIYKFINRRGKDERKNDLGENCILIRKLWKK